MKRVAPFTATDPQFMSYYLNGEVDLPLYCPLPQHLQSLLLGNDVWGREFRINLRAYNAAFAFTSLDYTPIDHGASAGGLQVFQIHSALYHVQGLLEPELGRALQYAQLYFHDLQYAADARAQRNPQLNPQTLQELTAMLHKVKNPYICVYRTARERLRSTGGTARVILTL
ncbi:hypothetical protein K469DRAFT_680202 [Zopfia rhizophila CBS 207.26]|uniref:Uncharacterized protein n=1 Tax=Zopfia rhizophila CBS 207.26 TaxID=1314779 RepID=A0A6A6D7B3_9PEZI|nr:hypothetical protein K469DRAFT_680202 [Zopfia rhizophila CBS 207.26]